MAEVIRWKRAQQQAITIGIEKLSAAEYLDSVIGIMRPLTRTNRALNTAVSNMEAEVQFNDPSDLFVKTCADKSIMYIKMMKAGHVAK